MHARSPETVIAYSPLRRSGLLNQALRHVNCLCFTSSSSFLNHLTQRWSVLRRPLRRVLASSRLAL